jgi:hypothetical protein
MPRVIIATGVVGPDGREETLMEYLCDRVGCANIATRFVGTCRELGFYVTCDEHAPGQQSAPESS